MLQEVRVQELEAGDIFGEQMFQDCWEDANMANVIRYLRGDRDLRLPEQLKRFIPAEIPPRTL